MVKETAFELKRFFYYYIEIKSLICYGCSSLVVESLGLDLDLGLRPGSAFAIPSWTLGIFFHIFEAQFFAL